MRRSGLQSRGWAESASPSPPCCSTKTMMNGLLDTSDHRRRAGLLLAIALISVGMWQTQIGSLILYPFTLLATWLHEMGTVSPRS